MSRTNAQLQGDLGEMAAREVKLLETIKALEAENDELKKKAATAGQSKSIAALTAAMSAPKAKQIGELDDLIAILPKGGVKEMLTDTRFLWARANAFEGSEAAGSYEGFISFVVGRINPLRNNSFSYTPGTFVSIRSRLIDGKSLSRDMCALLTKADAFFNYGSENNVWDLQWWAVTSMFRYATEIQSPAHPRYERGFASRSLTDRLTRNYYNARANPHAIKRQALAEKVLEAYKAYGDDQTKAMSFAATNAENLVLWYPAMVEFVLAYVFTRYVHSNPLGVVHQVIEAQVFEYLEPSYGLGEHISADDLISGAPKREREEQPDSEPRDTYSARYSAPRWEGGSRNLCALEPRQRYARLSQLRRMHEERPDNSSPPAGCQWLYHETSEEAATRILRSSTMVCGTTGAAGGGIYFSETPMDARVRARHRGATLRCLVFLGNTAVIAEQDNAVGLTFDDLRRRDFDSARLTFMRGGVFVVYMSDQVLAIERC